MIFTGIAAVSDDFGRVRVLLQDKYPSGLADPSWALLRDEIPKTHKEHRVPYELWAVDAEGLRGVAWLTLPAHRKEHWTKTAAELRGRAVRVEATLRPYAYAPGKPKTSKGGTSSAPADLPDEDGRITGTALDLALLEPHAP